jgi:glycosyltransferase involved in cell wall biosynthesis
MSIEAPSSNLGTQPLVSVGLPTYNGERYLREALDSLVGQDYANLEILVSDNASTDATFAIASAYAAKDPRVRATRHDKNMGPAANFNFVLQQTHGELFMWAADDDRWEPRYVSACLAALRRHPAAVLACSRLDFVGEDVDPEYERNYTGFDNPDLSSPSVRARIRDLMSRPGWYQIYGLIRREALGTDPLMSMYGGDVVLLVRLALRGPFARVDEVLFHYRVYPTRSGPRSPLAGLSDVALAARYTYLEEASERAIRASALSRADKIRAWAGLAEAAYLRPTLLRMQIRAEASYRVRRAIRDREPISTAKAGIIQGAKLAHSGFRRVMHAVRPDDSGGTR